MSTNSRWRLNWQECTDGLQYGLLWPRTYYVFLRTCGASILFRIAPTSAGNFIARRMRRVDKRCSPGGRMLSWLAYEYGTTRGNTPKYRCGGRTMRSLLCCLCRRHWYCHTIVSWFFVALPTTGLVSGHYRKLSTCLWSVSSLWLTVATGRALSTMKSRARVIIWVGARWFDYPTRFLTRSSTLACTDWHFVWAPTPLGQLWWHIFVLKSIGWRQCYRTGFCQQNSTLKTFSIWRRTLSRPVSALVVQA